MQERRKRDNVPMRKNKLYKVTFLSQGKSIELHARHVASSALWGFTEIGELVFDPPGESIVVDPTEEHHLWSDRRDGVHVLVAAHGYHRRAAQGQGAGGGRGR